MALVEIDANANVYEISAASGYDVSYWYNLVGPLRALGWIDRIRKQAYRITERGKIALAIEVGRRTKMRCRYRENKVTVKKFLFNLSRAATMPAAQ